jgi:hypothetical protein
MYNIVIYKGNVELNSKQGDSIIALIEWANKNMDEGQHYKYFMFPSI